MKPKGYGQDVRTERKRRKEHDGYYEGQCTFTSTKIYR